jgi:hypothetical protein
MRQIILQGLEQVYSKLFHMIAEFLPRFLVMLIIVLIGLLVALVLRYILGGVLGLTKLDRVAEHSFRCHHAGLGHRFRLGRSGSRPQSAGAILRRRQKG